MSWTFNWRFDWPSPATRSLETEWQIAWERSANSHVFQQPTLSRIWVECVAQPRGERALLLIAQDPTHKVYLPFTVVTQKWNRLWRRDLKALGGDLVFDYQDPLVDGPELSAEEWLTFWLALDKSSEAIKVDSVSLANLTDSGFAGKIDNIFSQKVNCATRTIAPRMDLRGVRDFDELLARVSQHHRSKVRRNLRAVAARNPRLTTYSKDNLPGAHRMFDEMLIAYDKQYGGDNGRRHKFSDTLNIKFYRNMIQEGLSGGWLHLSTFEVDGITISWHVGFLWKGRFYWYKPCYAVSHKREQPGHLHVAYLLMLGIAEGWDVFDFTVGNESYKLSWATDAPPVHQLSWHPSTLRGRFYSATNRAAQTLRSSNNPAPLSN